MRSLMLISFAMFLGLTSFEHSGARRESDLAAIESFDQRDAAAAKIDDVDTLTSLWTNDGVLYSR